jgi:putative transposase
MTRSVPGWTPRKTSEKALVAVIQEAWIGGVSTRRVDELVQAMGLSGISKSTVSKLCKDIDERVSAFLDRPLSGEALGGIRGDGPGPG